VAISGSLRDVSVADVIQFIQLGRRDGTLILTRAGDQATFRFDGGRLIQARAPGVPHLSALGIERGWVDAEVAERIAAEQAASSEPVRFGQLLVAKKVLQLDQVRQLLEEQVRRALTLVTGWDSGTFEFVAEQVERVDGFTMELAQAVGYNAQALLLEAARIFDEQNNRPAPPARPVALVPKEEVPESASAELRRSLDLEPVEEPGGTCLWVVSGDEATLRRLGSELMPRRVDVRAARFDELRGAVAGEIEPPEVVLLDLRGRDLTGEEKLLVRRLGSTSVVLAIASHGARHGDLYAAGVHTVLPPEAEAITAFVEFTVPTLRQNVSRSRSPVQRLRRVYDDMRAGMVSATVALNLMQLIAESFERAILFLVKRDEMSVLGAFGADSTGLSLAMSTRGLRLQCRGADALSRVIRERNALRTSFAEIDLPEALRHALAGEAAERHVVVLPVIGAERVIALVYADSSDKATVAQEIEVLELAASQVGIALENELLRAQISRQPKT
jgi:GAF domain-containing protein